MDEDPFVKEGIFIYGLTHAGVFREVRCRCKVINITKIISFSFSFLFVIDYFAFIASSRIHFGR